MSDANDRAKLTIQAGGPRPASDGGTRKAALPPETSRRLGDELKAFYDGLVSEPLPDRFLQLLEQLDEREQAGKRSDAGSCKDAGGAAG